MSASGRTGNRDHQELLITIYEVSKILSSSLDLRKTLYSVLNVLSSHLQMERGMVSLLQGGAETQVVAVSGLSKQEMQRARFRPGEGITGRILKTGSPLVVPDVAQEPLFLNRTGARTDIDQKIISFIGVPIKAGREVLGVLSVDRIRDDGQAINFDADVRFLSMVANLIGQAIKLNEGVAAEREQLMREQHRLQKELRGKYTLDNVIGQSKRMQEVFAEVHQAAPGRSTILLRGESGTGKEVIARAIHYMSPRKDGPFVKLNCAALPETLLESELFGHEKGAFTGATQERKGRFEMAHGGTLFLDEIGEITPAFQAKLLRVLQEREFERVGGNRTLRVDVRLITATNRNLEEAVAKGEFRADLYYRINVVSIFLPPLRERVEDIPLLIDYFLSKFNKESGRKLTISPEAMQVMLHCYWPGNVRELENCIERTATMTRGDVIREPDLPCQKDQCLSSVLWKYRTDQKIIPIMPVASTVEKSAVTSPAAPASPGPQLVPTRERLVWAMEQCGWVQAKAARLLGLTPRQIGYALKKYQVDLKHL